MTLFGFSLVIYQPTPILLILSTCTMWFLGLSFYTCNHALPLSWGIGGRGQIVTFPSSDILSSEPTLILSTNLKWRFGHNRNICHVLRQNYSCLSFMYQSMNRLTCTTTNKINVIHVLIEFIRFKNRNSNSGAPLLKLLKCLSCETVARHLKTLVVLNTGWVFIWQT